MIKRKLCNIGNIELVWVIEMIRTYKPRICEVCGKEYIPNSSTQKSCSDECRKLLRRRCTKKYYETHKEEHKVRTDRWRKANNDKMRKYYVEWRRKHREKTIDELFISIKVLNDEFFRNLRSSFILNKYLGS